MDLNFFLVNRKTIKQFIEEHHYSHSINGLKTSFCFALYDSLDMVGAVLFGGLSTTAWKKYGSSEGSVIELRRLVISDHMPRNTASWFVSRALKYIKVNSAVEIVVSYADPLYSHVGYVYQACNFIYIGKTPPDTLFYDSEYDRTYHSRALRTKYKGQYKPFVVRLRKKLVEGKLVKIRTQGKYTYVYPLNRHTKSRFEILKQEYPKGQTGLK